jgi:hypothetical protein
MTDKDCAANVWAPLQHCHAHFAKADGTASNEELLTQIRASGDIHSAQVIEF